MFVQLKPVYTVKFDASRGETPEMLMTAIALAVFDLAPVLDEGDVQVLTPAQAHQRVMNGRDLSMSLVNGRMCFTHIIATRLSGTAAEIVLSMYDRDGDALMRRADARMDELTEAAASEIFVDLHDIIGDDADTHEIPLDFFTGDEIEIDVDVSPLAATG